MSLKVHVALLIIVSLIFSTSALAHDTQEEKAVRKIIEMEIKGALEGKPDQMRSCYADGFVGYWAISPDIPMNKLTLNGFTVTADPEDWTIAVAKSEELDDYINNFTPEAAARRKKTGIARHNEVVSIKVKDGCALAVTLHSGTWQDKKTDDIINWERRTVWMLKKISGEWKITNYIGGVSRSVFIGKAAPTAQ